MFMVDVSLLYIVLEDLLVYMLEVQLTCRQSKQMPIILFYMVLVIFCCMWPEVAMVQIISTKTRHRYSKAFINTIKCPQGCGRRSGGDIL